MILNELQNYLSQHKKASLADMKLHFRMDGNALRGMLNKLIRKGRVSKMEDGKNVVDVTVVIQKRLNFMSGLDRQKYKNLTITHKLICRIIETRAKLIQYFV